MYALKQEQFVYHLQVSSMLPKIYKNKIGKKGFITRKNVVTQQRKFTGKLSIKRR